VGSVIVVTAFDVVALRPVIVVELVPLKEGTALVSAYGMTAGPWSDVPPVSPPPPPTPYPAPPPLLLELELPGKLTATPELKI
jgi:hypothetical protein